MSLVLLGLGTAGPEFSIDQGEAATIAGTFIHGDQKAKRALPSLFRRTHVERRRSVLLDSRNGNGPRQSFYPAAVFADDRGPGTEQRMDRYASDAAPLAMNAAREALADAQVSTQEITHLITVSCTGFNAPGVEFKLIDELGLSSEVSRVNVGFMGCHGALNGLGVAKAFATADSASRVLMCAVELCSLHYQYRSDPQHLVANALFADGAAALVAGPLVARADAEPWSLGAVGSYMIPNAEDAMTWRIGDHGFHMTLSPRVPDLIAEHLRPWLAGWLETQRLTIEDVASWAIHPGGPRIVESVAAALELPSDATQVSYEVLREHGNMSSATLLYVLERLWRRRAPLPCLALGFGPGLVAEAALFV